MATTLTNLLTRVRAAADMTNSTFVSDAEMTTWVNQGYAELYDLVVRAFEDYFTSPTPTTLTITTGNSVALPADFYKLRGLDHVEGGVAREIREFNFNERNRYHGSSFLYGDAFSDRRYRIMGDNLLITPEPQAIGTYRLYYVPAPTFLVNPSDTLPTSLSKFGWDEYIVLFAAERCLAKEESPTNDVVRQRSEIMSRVMQMAADRQVSQSEQIQDISQDTLLNRWWW